MLKSRYFIYGILVLTIIGMVFVGGCIKKQNLSGEELFFVIKDIFVNNGFTPDDLNPSFEGHSFGTCFYSPEGYEGYQLSIKFKNFGGAFFNHIYYFDDVYNTSEEEIAEKINNKIHLSATIKSTQNGKYIEESRSSGSSFIILCGHKAIIKIPFIEKHSNSDKFLEVVDEILHECNKYEELSSKNEEKAKEKFSFKIEEISYDCFKSENLFSYHLYVEKSSEDRGVMDDIIISYPKGAKLPVGEWKINTQVSTPSGDNYFENNATFKEFFLRPCNLPKRNCFSPFSYSNHFIPSPYVEGGSILVIVTSPDGKVEKKEVPLPSGNCNVLSLSGEQLFFVVKESFINNGFTPDDLNPSFEGHSDGRLFYGGGAYNKYEVNINVKINDTWSSLVSNSIYYFDDVYKTSEEELAEKINEKDYLSATIISTPNGKYIEESQSVGSFFILICGNKAIIHIPVIEEVRDRLLGVVEEVLPQCNN